MTPNQQNPSRLTLGEPSPQYFSQVAGSPWDNVYWFARMLINADKYGAVGTDTSTLRQLASGIRTVLISVPAQDDATAMQAGMEAIRRILYSRWHHTKKAISVEQLCTDLAEKLLTRMDFEVLVLTCEQIVIPISHALSEIPRDDSVFAQSIVGALLTAQGEAGLATVINLWDDLGSHGCMSAERVQIVQAFHVLRQHLTALHLDDTDEILPPSVKSSNDGLGKSARGEQVAV